MTQVLKRAAQYVRMSTEHQHYSIGHQQAAIAAYAAARGYEVVRTYADAGISGLRIENRRALQDLLATVVAGQADFSVILTYDVSRWGRFQDPDQSAHYEFICKDAGVTVEYCTEPFTNDGSLSSTLVKHIKRAMAAEYSRELSVKISGAQLRLSRMGFWQGGPATFGLRRMAISPDGTRGRLLERGDFKGGGTGDRTILVWGPDHEVATVRRIFRMYVVEGRTLQSIAAVLNAEGAVAEDGGAWARWRIRAVLQNELYVGTMVNGKARTRLGATQKEPRAAWRRTHGCCDPIVSDRLFEAARRNLTKFTRVMTDEQMLEGLREIFREHGRVSTVLLREDGRTYGACAYARRFGTLSTAYELAGIPLSSHQRAAIRVAKAHTPHLRRRSRAKLSQGELLAKLQVLLNAQGRLTVELMANAGGLPSVQTLIQRFGSIRGLYEAVGYQPTAHQLRAMKPRGSRRFRKLQVV